MPRFRLALLLTAALLAPLASAQDLPLPGEGFDWERVGDRPIETNDLAFGPDGPLWATADDGPHRLDLSGGFPGTWVLLHDSGVFRGSMLPLGPDTLLANSGSTTRRSLDGGLTWAIVYDEGDEGLYAVPAGYPYAGRILTGDYNDAAYSDDRGGSFTPSVVPDEGTGYTTGGEDFVALPPGSDHPGRVVMAGRGGVSLSDDGGATFVKSGLYEAGRYTGLSLCTAEADGAVRVLMAGYENAQPDLRVWYTDDSGATRHPEGGAHLPEGPPLGVGNSDATVLALGGPSALAVLGRGTVYRTDDAGATWEAVGRAPDIAGDVRLSTAALDAAGRLYVGLAQTGQNRAWTYRTAESLVTAAEPWVPVVANDLGLSVAPNPSRGAASVTFSLTRPGAVRVAVYDVLGREVAVLHDGPLAAGRHTLPFGAEDSAPGVYVVRVSTGTAVAARVVTRTR